MKILIILNQLYRLAKFLCMRNAPILDDDSDHSIDTTLRRQPF
jgi:hypothetical protein